MNILFRSIYSWMIWEYFHVFWIPPHGQFHQGLCPWRPVWENRGSISMLRVRFQADHDCGTDQEVDKARKLIWRVFHGCSLITTMVDDMLIYIFIKSKDYKYHSRGNITAVVQAICHMIDECGCVDWPLSPFWGFSMTLTDERIMKVWGCPPNNGA